MVERKLFSSKLSCECTLLTVAVVAFINWETPVPESYF